MDDGGYGIPQSVAAAAARCLVMKGRSSFRHPHVTAFRHGPPPSNDKCVRIIMPNLFESSKDLWHPGTLIDGALTSQTWVQGRHLLRQNLLYIWSGICLTLWSLLLRTRSRSMRSARAMRSSARNGLRPAAIVTNTSGPQASVHAVGSECCVPSPSTKKTRSSPHVWRITTNKNSRPHHGWNGCVTRTVRCAPSGSGVVDGSRQRLCRAMGEDGQDRMPRLDADHWIAPPASNPWGLCRALQLWPPTPRARAPVSSAVSTRPSSSSSRERPSKDSARRVSG
jgi:hypothetical protein